MTQVTQTDRTYAQALLELAEESGQVELIVDQARQVRSMLRTEVDLGRLLGNQVLGVADRAGMIDRLFQGRLHEVLFRFLHVANRHNRLASLPGILRAFDLAVEAKHGQVEVEAHTATPLSDAEAAAVARRLGEALKREVVLHAHTDPALVGGLKVRVADELIDGSVAAQLRRIRERMLAVRRQKA
jgi:F-type H+-transporting ATPase subunit delta